MESETRAPSPSTGRGDFLRRRGAVVVVCALVAPALALLATLTQDTRHAASARLIEDAAAERLVARNGGSGPMVDAGAVERRTAAQVGWTPRDVARATSARRLSRHAVETRAVAARRDVVAPLANAVATEYLAQYRRLLRTALVTARDAARQRARAARGTDERRAARRAAGRLDALAVSGGDARLTARARGAAVVARPPVARNVALAAAAGLLVGLVLAALLDSADRRRAPHRAPEPQPDPLADSLGEAEVDAGPDTRHDREMARFVALNLLLDGAGPDDVRRHLAEHFEVDGHEELIDEAVRRAES